MTFDELESMMYEVFVLREEAKRIEEEIKKILIEEGVA